MQYWLPDDVWQYIKSFMIHDPRAGAMKRRVTRQIEGCFYVYISGFSEYRGIIRHYYYLNTPLGQLNIIDYCG